ncbi:hypothetical protein [Campylobacter aviculae]|uniref:Uncharacterized protein n=1 Tax=Campylobacter aviculae TaxID=2510190 RepID=A0A4U7BK83_9BACT|nr:hypothetical protein [Campylobacter aviculae]TKX32388.1 hypothetical protein CQA76_03435 [Campylobacter aviculae]
MANAMLLNSAEEEKVLNEVITINFSFISGKYKNFYYESQALGVYTTFNYEFVLGENIGIIFLQLYGELDNGNVYYIQDFAVGKGRISLAPNQGTKCLRIIAGIFLNDTYTSNLPDFKTKKIY